MLQEHLIPVNIKMDWPLASFTGPIKPSFAGYTENVGYRTKRVASLYPDGAYILSSKGSSH